MKRTYYTNGVNEVRLLPDEPIPDGWYKGRVKPVFKATGYRWINNGIKEITIASGVDIPDGYVIGRLPFSITRIEKQRDILKRKQYRIYNNGVVEMMVSKDDPIPDGYVRGRLPMSQQQKDKISKSHLGLHHTEESRRLISEHSNNNRQKAKETCMNRYGVPYAMMVEEYQTKANATKRKNNTFNSSKPEIEFYKSLVAQYGERNVLRHYKSEKYPFYCDFYIVPTEEYIELNLHWTHGGRPYIEGDVECDKQLKEWIEKSHTSQFYANAIDTWTVRDVKKLETAKQNGLSYRVLYSLD